MIRLYRAVLIALSGLAAGAAGSPDAAAQPRPASSSTKGSPIESVCDEMNRRFLQAFNVDGIDALMKLYDRDATLIATPGKPAKGSAAIREALSAFLSTKGTITGNMVQCVVAGDVALMRVKWTLRGTASDGKPLEMQGESADILRRQRNGTWAYIIDQPYGIR